MDIFSALKNLFVKLIYGNDVELLYHPNRRDQSMLTLEAVIAVTGLALIQGTFQQKFLILMGASDPIIAFLPILGPVAGLAAIFGGAVFDKRKKRKKIIVSMLLIARLTLASIVYVPLFVPKEKSIPIIMSMIIFASIISNIADVGYNSWLTAIVPPEIRGRFMAVRTIICQMILPIVPVVAAVFVDNTVNKHIAFIVLSSIGAVMIIAEAAVMSKVNEPVYIMPFNNKRSPMIMLKILLANKPFCLFAVNNIIFYFFLYISGSFTSLYMLKYNHLSLTLVTIAGTYCTLIMLFLYRRFGKLTDKIGAGKVLFIAQCVFAVEMFSWVLVPPALLQYLIFIPFTLQALSNSASSLSFYSRKYDFIPEENRNFFTGALVAVLAIPLLLGPIVGNLIKGQIEAHSPQWVLNGLWQFRFLYLIAATLIVLQKVFTYIKKKKFEV